jgi:hypothetical protein
MIVGSPAELMNKLGVAKSRSRARVSKDNPYIESHFKTLNTARTIPSGSTWPKPPAPGAVPFYVV